MRNVLFLCTGNSARSIIAEALLNHRGGGRIRAFSAGSRPAGRVHPQALALLERAGVPAPAARSKNWNEFAAPGAPRLDVVITVCDDAAAETCPVWLGSPMTVHWGVADPAAAAGTERDIAAAFADAYSVLDHRVRALVALLPIGSGDAGLERRLRAIGLSRPPRVRGGQDTEG